MSRGLDRIAREDPHLAARLIAMAMPAAARDDAASYDLIVRDVGAWRVSAGRMERLNGQPGTVDFRLATDAAGFVALAFGESPVKLMLSGRVRVRGNRRAASRLRPLEPAGISVAAGLRAGAELDTEAFFRMLPYLVDPKWTRGHSFVVGYHVDPAGTWYVHVNDGVVSVSDAANADTHVHVSLEAFRGMVAGSVSSAAVGGVRGKQHPATLLGRWIERAQGRDDADQEREDRQRIVQANRVGTWGSHPEAAIGAGALPGYGELYALWERQHWSAHTIDFAVDRDHWATTPRDAQDDLIWSFGMAAPRSAADLAWLLAAAPSTELEVLIAAQLADAARHVAFYDRFAAEVLALESDDTGARLADLAVRAAPSPAELTSAALGAVEAAAVRYLLIDGVLAVTAQHLARDHLERRGLFPAFCAGLERVERDTHRHVAFGVRLLKDAIEREPAVRQPVAERIAELAPQALRALAPERWAVYGYEPEAVHGFASGKLERRMKVLGLGEPAGEPSESEPVAVRA